MDTSLSSQLSAGKSQGAWGGDAHRLLQELALTSQPPEEELEKKPVLGNPWQQGLVYSSGSGSRIKGCNIIQGLPWRLRGKEPPADVGDAGWIPDPGR